MELFGGAWWFPGISPVVYMVHKGDSSCCTCLGLGTVLSTGWFDQACGSSAQVLLSQKEGFVGLAVWSWKGYRAHGVNESWVGRPC